MIPAAFASWVTERLADALGWSYRSSAIVNVADGAVGCTAFFVGSTSRASPGDWWSHCRCSSLSELSSGPRCTTESWAEAK
jgi:hypothetical protein